MNEKFGKSRVVVTENYINQVAMYKIGVSLLMLYVVSYLIEYNYIKQVVLKNGFRVINYDDIDLIYVLNLEKIYGSKYFLFLWNCRVVKNKTSPFFGSLQI